MLQKTVEPALFVDGQGTPPAGYCPVCGGALYWPSLVCSRCGREEAPHDAL